ncbi:MAG: bifunctional sulfate adenylyltransferase/adenylylsulfate kinase [Gammaproteobacteria bacterium]
MTDLSDTLNGELASALVDSERAETLKNESIDFASITLSLRQLCDFELMANGGFSPISGFMGERDTTSVLDSMRVSDGALWPVPLTLDVDAQTAETLSTGVHVALRDNEGFMLGVLKVSDIWQPDVRAESEKLFGTTDQSHPGVQALLADEGKVRLGGRVEAVQTPNHYDFEALRYTPTQLRSQFARLGWRQIVAFHTSRPVHRLQRAMCIEAAKIANAHVLIHPVVGISRPGDVSYHTRIQCYRAAQRYFPHGIALLALLPLAMRMAGPREALWHAIVRRNYGCTHIAIANDHGSPPRRGEERTQFYDPYAAQELVSKHQDEIGIEVVPFEEHAYSRERKRYVPVSQVADEDVQSYSTADFNKALSMGDPVPEWYTYPEVVDVLKHAHPPRSKQGATLLFTGLSGAGKSTIAKIVYGKLIEQGNRPVTLLDGDVVRLNLSSELGFSKAHRDLNVRRIGFVASEITKNRGFAICAPIAPYSATRRAVREMVSEHGAFIEVHVSTPLDVCESRDRKGLYAKARRGIIPEFTGVSDPYEVPQNPELRIDTTSLSPMEAAEEVYLYLVREGYLDTSDEPIM